MVTCQGKDATIVGPTGEYNTTTGTEGDDVIVAPLALGLGRVEGLAGNDTICLVSEAVPNPHGIGSTSVDAGAGDDSVLNETLSRVNPYVALGAGGDHYVGNDFFESVAAGGGGVPDTEVDVIETVGGNDSIGSGDASPGIENHDLIYTGAGHDSVNYANPSGERIDNGPGAEGDSLYFDSGTPEAMAIDNAGKRLSVGDRTLLTWTNVDTFQTTAAYGDSLSFLGTDADERLDIFGPYTGFTPRGGSISTGGGNDSVHAENYLPRRLDLGVGRDDLTYKMYRSCGVVSIALDTSADCTTLQGQEDVVTRLGGIELLDAQTHDRLTVRGTSRGDDIFARSPVVRVHARSGADRVYVERSRVSEVWGGRGNDRLTGIARETIVLHGSQGDDFLRGSAGPDRLYGGAGRDVASGRGGKDVCVAEVRRGCELPR